MCATGIPPNDGQLQVPACLASLQQFMAAAEDAGNSEACPTLLK